MAKGTTGHMAAVQSQLQVMQTSIKAGPLQKSGVRNGHTRSVLDNYEISMQKLGNPSLDNSTTKNYRKMDGILKSSDKLQQSNIVGIAGRQSQVMNN